MAGVKGRSGGARPGSGRKSNAEKYARPVADAEKKIVDRLPSIVDSMLVLAEGVKVLDVNIVTGDETVYSRPPDRQACQYLMDRIMGKPTERTELNADVSGTVSIGGLREALGVE